MTADAARRMTMVKAAVSVLALAWAAASLVALASLSPKPGDASDNSNGRVTLEQSPLER